MEYISSDTSVWIDFTVISRTALPFYLPYTYIMNRDAMEDELLSPKGLRNQLLECGLISVEISLEEFTLAEAFGLRYLRLSTYDRIALAIAKIRNITLLTGDGDLRKVAASERVEVIGTLGILDKLLSGEFIQADEYKYCLVELLKHNGLEVRLPKSELTLRLQKC